MKRAHGTGGLYLRGGPKGVWWVRLSRGGKAIRLSTGIRGGSPGKPPKEAQIALAEKLSDLIRQPGTVESERIKFEHLGKALETQYKAEGRTASLRSFNQRWPALAKHFGGMKAADITRRGVTEYAVLRRDRDRMSVAVVNLELSLLRRSFSLLRDSIPNPPKITHLPGANRRQGKVPDETFEAIAQKIIPRFYEPVIRFLRRTGWRSKYSTLLEWRHVDWDAGALRYPTSKSGKPLERAFRRDAPLLELLETLHQTRQAVTPWVFCHPDGSPITLDGLRGAWAKACKAVGYRGGLHNLRRTRVNEQERNGIPPMIGMAMVGISTPWVYRLYSSVGTADQEEWLERESKAEPENVRRFGK